MKDSSPFAIGNRLSAKSARKVVKARALAPETVMNFAADATHQLVIIRKEQNTHEERLPTKKDNKDHVFYNLIYEMLQQIPNCEDNFIYFIFYFQFILR